MIRFVDLTAALLSDSPVCGFFDTIPDRFIENHFGCHDFDSMDDIAVGTILSAIHCKRCDKPKWPKQAKQKTCVPCLFLRCNQSAKHSKEQPSHQGHKNNNKLLWSHGLCSGCWCGKTLQPARFSILALRGLRSIPNVVFARLSRMAGAASAVNSVNCHGGEPSIRPKDRRATAPRDNTSRDSDNTSRADLALSPPPAFCGSGSPHVC